MKKFVNTFIFFVVSVLTIEAQTVAPMVFGDEYRIIKDMDVYENKVVVLTTNDAIPTGSTKPLHLAIYENEQWTKVSPYFLNNGVEDTVRASSFPKLTIAPNGDIWIAAVYLYQYSNGNWKKHHIENFDTTKVNRTYRLVKATNQNKLLVFSEENGGADIFTIDLENSDINLREKKYQNQFLQPDRNYPYESVFEVDGYTFSQRSTSYDPKDNEPDFLINTPDDTILQLKLPTPNGENGGRQIMQMYAKNMDEIWIVTDNSEGSVELDKFYTCCGGVFVLRNLKDWESVSDAETYPVNLNTGLNIPALGINKIKDNLFEILVGSNPTSNLANEIYLYNSDTKTFTKTDWDIIMKNSTGYRASNQIITEFKLAHILEELSKNQRSMYFQNGDNFLKIKVDANGNRWFMSKSFILKTPPIEHPTTVAELDLNQQFRIVPNPASQTISLKGKTELLKHIEILNLQGETLIKVEGEFNNISIRPFANGVYFVRKTLKNGSEEFSKFIKE